jgi:hypothetical protein
MGLYGALSWFLSKNISEIGFQIVKAVVLDPSVFHDWILIGTLFQHSTSHFDSLLSSQQIGLGYMVAVWTERWLTNGKWDYSFLPAHWCQLLNADSVPFILFGFHTYHP